MNVLDETDHFRINAKVKADLKEEFQYVSENDMKPHKLNRNLL